MMMKCSTPARHLALPLVIAASLSACHRHAPEDDPETVEALVAAARAGTERYRSRATAIAEGYRRVGVEFPAMGEHWVNLARVMADSFIPGEPPVLTYVDVEGVPQLAGVAYTALLAPDEVPPDFRPARGHWHEHNGSIVDESFAVGHGTHGGSEDTRLAILHAWVWSRNPDGLFATDNWTLPYARLGVAAPASPGGYAARAAALAAGSAEYYWLALEEGAELSERERATAAALLAARRSNLRESLAAARRRGRLTPPESAALEESWGLFWREMEAVLPTRVGELRALRRRLAGE